MTYINNENTLYEKSPKYFGRCDIKYEPLSLNDNGKEGFANQKNIATWWLSCNKLPVTDEALKILNSKFRNNHNISVSEWSSHNFGAGI